MRKISIWDILGRSIWVLICLFILLNFLFSIFSGYNSLIIGLAGTDAEASFSYTAGSPYSKGRQARYVIIEDWYGTKHSVKKEGIYMSSTSPWGSSLPGMAYHDRVAIGTRNYLLAEAVFRFYTVVVFGYLIVKFVILYINVKLMKRTYPSDPGDDDKPTSTFAIVLAGLIIIGTLVFGMP